MSYRQNKVSGASGIVDRVNRIPQGYYNIGVSLLNSYAFESAAKNLLSPAR